MDSKSSTGATKRFDAAVRMLHDETGEMEKMGKSLSYTPRGQGHSEGGPMAMLSSVYWMDPLSGSGGSEHRGT